MTLYYVGVGINSYKTNELHGCVNDILDTAQFLTEYKGLKAPDNARILVNERATRGNIIERFQWMNEISKGGDICIFQYSGHGSQIAERFNSGEVDGMDEIILPVDFDWENNFITDDMIHDFAKDLSRDGALPVFIFDSCHSGTMYRDLKQVGTVPTPKVIAPPVDIQFRSWGKHLDKETFQNSSSIFGVCATACLESQVAQDIYSPELGKFNGAFTRSFLDVLKDNPDYTWDELDTKVRHVMKLKGYTQTPSIMFNTESKNRRVFE